MNLLLEDLNGPTLYLLYECSFCCFDFSQTYQWGSPLKNINFGHYVILGLPLPPKEILEVLYGLWLVWTPDSSSNPLSYK